MHDTFTCVYFAKVQLKSTTSKYQVSGGTGCLNLTDLLSALPLGELDGGDFPLAGVSLQLGLQASPHHLGGHVRVLDVAANKRSGIVT